MSDTQTRNGPALATSSARAYGGPAHGRRWTVPAAVEPPDQVVIEDDTTTVAYVLVHHPRLHRPARDHLGNYVYMPVRHGFAPGE